LTEKQERILHSALRLFATEGYASTSTSKVAKTAGVSEGLIFRHFGNKEGLLNAIMDQSKEAARQMVAEIILTPEPKELLRKLLEMPFNIGKEHYEMWRLVYALKWQTDQYDTSTQEPLKVALINAFQKLGYADPDAETELVLMFMDGAATALLLHEPDRKMEILSALKEKYKL